VQKTHDDHLKSVDAAVKAKEAEIMKSDAPAPISPPRGIIMDGNGRWASERGCRPFGHRAGMKAVREAVEGRLTRASRS